MVQFGTVFAHLLSDAIPEREEHPHRDRPADGGGAPARAFRDPRRPIA